MSRWNRRGPAYIPIYPPVLHGQDRARGPRPSSPIEPPGGAPLLVFSSPPFLDSTYLISLSPCPAPPPLFFLPPTPLLAFLPSLSLSLFLSFSLSLYFLLSRSHSLLPDLGSIADFFGPFCSGPRRLCPAPRARFVEEIFGHGFVMRLVLLTHWDHALSELSPLTANVVQYVQLGARIS